MAWPAGMLRGAWARRVHPTPGLAAPHVIVCPGIGRLTMVDVMGHALLPIVRLNIGRQQGPGHLFIQASTITSSW